MRSLTRGRVAGLRDRMPFRPRPPALLQFHREAVPTPDHRGATFERHWMLWRYCATALAARRTVPDGLMEQVRVFCFFVGFQRSGHSVFGSLLDAHRNIVISHELDALHLVEAGFSQRQLFYLILRNSEAFAQVGRGWSGYSYEVPGQWQGRYERLHVVGDKKGGLTSQRLYQRPALLLTLRRRLRVGIKIILYFRNPFDCISSDLRRQGRPALGQDLIDGFFEQSEGVAGVRQAAAAHELIEVYHEDVLARPAEELRRVITWLGEAAPEDYLDHAIRPLNRSPDRSRERVDWSPDLIKQVENRLHAYPCLSRYSWQS